MSDALTAAESSGHLDLRLVKYFVVVAEHANFGRAAAALHLAQPSLSRQIQRLEATVGARLLERGAQGSRLTAAGAAFFPLAQQLLRAADEAMSVVRAAVSQRTITLGYVDDLVITPAAQDLRRRHPEAQVHLQHLTWDQVGALPDGRVDVLVTRTPMAIPTDGLRTTVLRQERRVLVVPATHRLAGKESVTQDDFADEPHVPCTGTHPSWTGFWRLDPRPDGSPAPLGPTVVETFEDKLELIADGRAIAVMPAGDRRSSLRNDIVTIPVDGIDDCAVVVVNRADDENPLIAQFIESAKEFLGPDA
ncbi:LysR family transcriptional regulator [Streptomyces bauhiniae]|uniref:LysR family transcriptional regulator n=1 Tax=Streptomyces bauhiniae TaxID=2340725 RepID=A0A7K3QUJ5_9ACTN|nr:LysR family transcriptional regulator [Streptomyces bauhiniae]NEB93520.1 LysR family transcriptional regulator [Streptomyces bauhiniae]